MSAPLFDSGATVVTPGALALLKRLGHDPALALHALLKRHLTRDGIGTSPTSGSSTWVVAVPTGTPQTFRLKMDYTAEPGCQPSSCSTYGAGAEMSSITAPFGSIQ
jgi:hypothetical protein